MQIPISRTAATQCVVCFVALAVAMSSTSAQVNSWVNPGGGNWDQPANWSLNVRPNGSQSVFITNSNWKAVAINPSTPVNFPESMAVNDLTIRGASNTFNTLLLNFAGTAVPLSVSTGLTIADNARILNFNSGLVVQSGDFTVTNAQMVQDGGFVRATNSTMFLLNAAYHMTNGVFEGGSVLAGTPFPAIPGQFNQYGGQVRIMNLGLNHQYSLYGGTLDLPGGINLFGRPGHTSYFQSGGTNRTPYVVMWPAQFGSTPVITLNGGLLAVGDIELHGDRYGGAMVNQNGGMHIVTNRLLIAGGAQNPDNVKPAGYYLNNGMLSARNIELDANQGDSLFAQSNGTTRAETFFAHSVGYFLSFVTRITLAGGSLSCSNFTLDDGRGMLNQTGGALVVSNLLSLRGYRDAIIRYYGAYSFTGGTLTASNIDIAADLIIGEGSANRISNPGFFRLSHTLRIGNAVEQLGRFILASNATISLAGSASRLSFANSSGEAWVGGTMLTVSDWNGNLTGGGAEQLRFGTSQSGLTPAQLSQIQFVVGTNIYAARILGTGEVVPNQASPPGGIVNSWINPGSGNWDVSMNWSLGIRPDGSQAVMITNSGWKAVAINASTPVNFPGSMTVSHLTIRGAWDTYNTLLLNFFGTTVPLTVLNGLTVADNAQILNFNSGLDVQGGTFTVTNAQIVQNGGYVGAMKVTMNLQNAVYQMTNGLFEGGSVVLGFPVSASFNQYGGLAIITNLVFGQGNSAAGGHYSLYGGDLRLPNGLRLLGGNNARSSYFQAGGTNRTTSVFLEPNIFGISPSFTLNGGLLADNDVTVLADNFGSMTLQHNGGTHIVSNLLTIAGGASAGASPRPANYLLNGGTLIASNILLNGSQGDAGFFQTNGLAQVGQMQASSGGQFTFFTTRIGLSGGAFSAGSVSATDGGTILQSGGTMVVSNALNVVGFRGDSFRVYTRYTLLGGTLTASNINIGGDFIIGDSSTNRISNPGTLSLSHLLRMGNAVEQFGRFILVSNSIIDLAGNASRLSFANSSGQTWATGATLVVSNWNGNAFGGGAEQLRFGTNQTGLTAAQLGQIRFRIGNDLLSARILSTGEVVTDQLIPPSVNLEFSREGNNLVLSWPDGWTLQSATNVVGPYFDVLGASSPYTVQTAAEPQQFFRLRQ
jgi:hypothetical protein